MIRAVSGYQRSAIGCARNALYNVEVEVRYLVDTIRDFARLRQDALQSTLLTPSQIHRTCVRIADTPKHHHWLAPPKPTDARDQTSCDTVMRHTHFHISYERYGGSQECSDSTTGNVTDASSLMFAFSSAFSCFSLLSFLPFDLRGDRLRSFFSIFSKRFSEYWRRSASS